MLSKQYPRKGRKSHRGLLFKESVKRYAWLAEPIASGFGISQIITKVGEIIT